MWEREREREREREEEEEEEVVEVSNFQQWPQGVTLSQVQIFFFNF